MESSWRGWLNMLKRKYIYRLQKSPHIYIYMLVVLLPLICFKKFPLISILLSFFSIPMFLPVIIGLYNRLVIIDNEIIIKRLFYKSICIPISNVFKISIDKRENTIGNWRGHYTSKTSEVNFCNIEKKILGKLPLDGWDNSKDIEKIKKELRLRGNAFL